MQKNCTGGGRCELCGKQRVAKQLCLAEDGRALPFFELKIQNALKKALKKFVGKPSEEGSCMIVAGGASIYPLPGVFVLGNPFLSSLAKKTAPARKLAAQGASRW